MDQIREVLIHGNYLSQKDIDICLGFDLEPLAVQPSHEKIGVLYEALRTKYGLDCASVAAGITTCSGGRRYALSPNRMQSLKDS